MALVYRDFFSYYLNITGGIMQTVLVIDDEKLILDLLEKVLTKFGYRVKIASNGQEGIDTFERGGVDLVITDIRMPDLDGFGVARHIRKSRKKRTPIIAISGTPWSLENGYFDQVLSRTFSIQILRDAVDNLTFQTACSA